VRRGSPRRERVEEHALGLSIDRLPDALRAATASRERPRSLEIADTDQASKIAGPNHCSATDAGGPKRSRNALAADEEQALGGARSVSVPLLHP
jgi:hypothetical protein